MADDLRSVIESAPCSLDYTDVTRTYTVRFDYDGVRYSAVKISRTSYSSETTPEVTVDGYGMPLTKAGVPSRANNGGWFRLPVEIAEVVEASREDET